MCEGISAVQIGPYSMVSSMSTGQSIKSSRLPMLMESCKREVECEWMSGDEHLIVVKNGDDEKCNCFVVAAGNHRMLLCKLQGLTQVPFRVLDMTGICVDWRGLRIQDDGHSVVGILQMTESWPILFAFLEELQVSNNLKTKYEEAGCEYYRGQRTRKLQNKKATGPELF